MYSSIDSSAVTMTKGNMKIFHLDLKVLSIGLLFVSIIYGVSDIDSISLVDLKKANEPQSKKCPENYS